MIFQQGPDLTEDPCGGMHPENQSGAVQSGHCLIVSLMDEIWKQCTLENEKCQNIK